ALDRNYAEPLKGDSIKISVKAAAAGESVEIKVYNISGERVRQFNFNTAAIGWNEGYWDCKNDAGKTVGQGLYFIRITRAGTVETRRVFVVK
ncbi:MAG TPA: FlgD immunoglobulin-like domain containing protein, partial [Candidatus Goldiibacteriota bacterium]|nr:FlgD immunoglobulin-like domain containing protein [Candidatus Goldiibacteriota bacterium]